MADNGLAQSLFGGTLRSDVLCAGCGALSTAHEQFTHLSLDLPPPSQVHSWGA